jgi:hypothetical protein
MYRGSRALSATTATLLTPFVALALSQPTPALASRKPLDAATVHEKVFKRGVDRWICVKEDNGIVLVGRILSIGSQSFMMQAHHEDHPTEIFYKDVIEFRGGLSRGGVIAAIVVPTAMMGVGIGIAVHLHDDFNKQLQQQPPFPATR